MRKPLIVLPVFALLSASGFSWGAQETLSGFRLQTCAENSECFDIRSPLARRGYIGSFYILDGPLTVEAKDSASPAKVQRYRGDDALYSIASNTLMVRGPHEDVLIELKSGRVNRFPHR